jgi:hypothetical protein
LAIQQLQPNTNRKVLCALGAKAYSASIKKCSPNILQAFHKNQIKVVVLENAIGKIKDSTGTVQSYSDWFQELKILSKFW